MVAVVESPVVKYKRYSPAGTELAHPNVAEPLAEFAAIMKGVGQKAKLLEAGVTVICLDAAVYSKMDNAAEYVPLVIAIGEVQDEDCTQLI